MAKNTQSRSNAEAALIRKAWADKSFKDQLMKDPNATYRAELTAAGATVEAGTEVRALEETGKVLYLVIPKVEIDPDTEVKLDERSTRADFEASLIVRALREPAFLQELRRDAKAAYERQLAAVRPGAKLPDDVAIQVCEESANVLYFRLPQPPPQGGELSEAELEAVAGGIAAVGVAIVSTVVVGAVLGAVALLTDDQPIGDAIPMDGAAN